MTFKKVEGKDSNDVVPDLAEAIPAPQDGGKTYVFQLRKGVKFSTGKDVTPADVRGHVRTDLQGLEPDRGLLLQRDRRGRRLPQGSRDLQP